MTTRDDELAELRAEVEHLRAAHETLRERAQRVESELGASQALHRAAIESLPFDFWARDPEGYCFSQNATTRANWGDLLGKRPGDMGLPEDVVAKWESNNARALAGEIVHGDVEYVIHGELRSFHNILAPIRDGDRILGTLGVNIDVTERNRAEAERLQLDRRLRDGQRLESLGLLAGGVAHDFNNLLTIILGAASLARRTTETPAERDRDLETIETAARRAAELCDQLLAYAGRSSVKLERVDLAHVVTETARLLRSTLPPEIELAVRPAPGPLLVRVDATQIRQVVLNLLLNAAEALRGRSGTIAVSTSIVRGTDADDLPPGEHVVLEVRDDGVGMSKETQARIFEPFFTTKDTGRGLGLSAVLGIVHAHHGALRVESELGVGSTFRLLLPPLDPETPPLGPASLAPSRVLARRVAVRSFLRSSARACLAHRGRQGGGGSSVARSSVRPSRTRRSAHAISRWTSTLRAAPRRERYESAVPATTTNALLAGLAGPTTSSSSTSAAVSTRQAGVARPSAVSAPVSGRT